jgi:hypothetical protein
MLKSLHAQRDAHHQHQSTHVIAKLLQSDFVDQQLLANQPNVEQQKLHHAPEDVLQHHQLQPQLFQIHVTAKLLQSENAELQSPANLPSVEQQKLQHVDKDVLQLNHHQ